MRSYRFKPFLIKSTLLLPGKFALGFVLVMLELHFFTPSINLNTRQGAIGDVVVVGIVGVVVVVVLVMLVLSFLNALNESLLPGKMWLQGGGAGVAVNCSNVHRDE